MFGRPHPNRKLKPLPLKTRTEEYRDRAEDCQLQAEKAISPAARVGWLRLMEEWLKLAQTVEQTTRSR